MAVYRLIDQPVFPDPEEAEPDGLIAVGGDLSPQRLLTAYASGIFPWYGPGLPILWWSLNPRLVLAPSEVHVPTSLRRTLNADRYEITLDTAFEEVIRACAGSPRPGQEGTWLVPEMVEAYVELHRLGFAHSVEARREGRLAGGLYGVSLGRFFSGESMFFHEPDASKTAFVALCRLLELWDFPLVDCQQPTPNLARFGAAPIPRRTFLHALRRTLDHPTRRGPWRTRLVFQGGDWREPEGRE